MFILFYYYYIDVFGLVRYICLPEHHKTSFFLEKSRRCGKNTVRFIIHKTNYSYKPEIGRSRSPSARLCQSPWLVWVAGMGSWSPHYKWLAAISVRCTCLIRKYSCANSPSAQTSTRIYWQCASHDEILADAIL